MTFGLKKNMTLIEQILNGGRTVPDQIAVVTPSEQVTYRELSHRINQRALELKDQGVKERTGYVWRAMQDVDFLVTYFALHQIGAVAVPLEQSIPEQTLRNIEEEVAAYDFPSGTADLLFTSGSTGKSKGVLLSETALSTCSENFIDAHHYTSDLVFIISGPLSHIASLFKIHPTLMALGTVCVIDGLKDMNAFFDVFRQMPHRRFASFLVPASIRLLLKFSREELLEVAPQIEFIETGAAPITQDDMRELARVLPNAHLFNTLGGTEIGAVCTYDFNDGKYMAGCVGRPMLHSRITLNEQGTVLISGPTLMTGYFNNEALTREVLFDGVFHSSDRGRFDEDGNLHLLGRSDDAINVGGFKADPVEIENVAMTHPQVSDCICVAAPHPIAGYCIQLLYVLKKDATASKRDIALYLKSRLEAYKVPTLYECVPAIRYKANGKKDRQSYKNE